MKLYINSHTDPHFNLAAEEYLLTHADDDIIMLWRNEAAVIIGKNQNAYAEINFDFTEKNNVKVVRRLTGGGAVFHDLGNVNFTFISPKGSALSQGIREGGLDFAHFTKPIVSALENLGISAGLSGRNDIVAFTDDGERKISGNAQCVLNGVTLHHGTLLFSASIERLQGALNVDPTKLKTKGIASVRSRVANIYDLLGDDAKEKIGDVSGFMDYLSKCLGAEFAVNPQDFDARTERGISELADAKYRKDEWNLQKFATFEKNLRRRFPFGSVEISMSVEGGKISALRIFGDFFGVDDCDKLSEKLIGCTPSHADIMCALGEVDVGEYIFGASAEDIASLICDFDTVL